MALSKASALPSMPEHENSLTSVATNAFRGLVSARPSGLVPAQNGRAVSILEAFASQVPINGPNMSSRGARPSSGLSMNLFGPGLSMHSGTDASWDKDGLDVADMKLLGGLANARGSTLVQMDKVHGQVCRILAGRCNMPTAALCVCRRCWWGGTCHQLHTCEYYQLRTCECLP